MPAADVKAATTAPAPVFVDPDPDLAAGHSFNKDDELVAMGRTPDSYDPEFPPTIKRQSVVARMMPTEKAALAGAAYAAGMSMSALVRAGDAGCRRLCRVIAGSAAPLRRASGRRFVGSLDVGEILVSEGLAAKFVCGKPSCPKLPSP